MGCVSSPPSPGDNTTCTHSLWKPCTTVLVCKYEWPHLISKKEKEGKSDHTHEISLACKQPLSLRGCQAYADVCALVREAVVPVQPCDLVCVTFDILQCLHCVCSMGLGLLSASMEAHSCLHSSHCISSLHISSLILIFPLYPCYHPLIDSLYFWLWKQVFHPVYFSSTFALMLLMFPPFSSFSCHISSVSYLILSHLTSLFPHFS